LFVAPGSRRLHAVTSISGGVISTTFTYDPNGNQLSGNGRATTWTSYNKPASISQGSTTISFLDDPEHRRFMQMTPQGTTLYFDGFGAHAELVMSSWKWNDYLTVGNVMVGVRFFNGSTATTRYFYTDHLGSISVITGPNDNCLFGMNWSRACSVHATYSALCMEIKTESIEELRKLYKDAYGKDLTYGEAEEIGQRLVTLYRLLRHPLPNEKPDSREPSGQNAP
jgi:hypothetical protein